MEPKKKRARAGAVAAMLTVTGLLWGYLGIFFSLPGDLSVVEGGEVILPGKFPVTLELPASASEIAQVEGDLFGESVIRAGGQEVQGQGVLAQYKLFGVVPIGGVNIQVLPDVELVPCGSTAGVRMLTDGVMIVGFSDVVCGGQMCNPALEAGLAMQDVITHMNGLEIHSVEELSLVLEQSGEAPLEITYRRGQQTRSTVLQPKRDDTDGASKLGLWVRDSAAGIGTITFVDPETGFFGGLGHGICDVDTGQLMPLYQGVIQEASVVDVTPGQKGEPGELHGQYGESQLGQLTLNTSSGIFGVLDEMPQQLGQAMPIALQGEIEEGEATILSNVEGNRVQEFTVEIQRVMHGSGVEGRNMLLQVTDPELLEKTGGIVQGMSGSPILQNGKLVGAVTHVLIDDPTRGYGIFIENMLRQGQAAYQQPAA
ncbi:MAG: SpoIVB peptidase [Eubacteriales bacterium]